MTTKLKALCLTALLNLNCASFVPYRVKYENDRLMDYKNFVSSVYEIRTDSITCGTGFVYQDKIVTANHIIDNGEKAFISNGDETRELKVLNRHETLDLLVADNPFHVKSDFGIAEARIGTAYIIGNSECGGLNFREVQVTNIHSGFNWADNEFAVEGKINRGDSGSPVFVIQDGKPYVIGVLVSKRVDKDSGTAVKIGKIKEDLE